MNPLLLVIVTLFLLSETSTAQRKCFDSNDCFELQGKIICVCCCFCLVYAQVFSWFASNNYSSSSVYITPVHRLCNHWLLNSSLLWILVDIHSFINWSIHSFFSFYTFLSRSRCRRNRYHSVSIGPQWWCLFQVLCATIGRLGRKLWDLWPTVSISH